MLWAAFSNVVVDTCVDCWFGPRGVPKASDDIEYMDIRLVILAAESVVMSGVDDHLEGRSRSIYAAQDVSRKIGRRYCQFARQFEKVNGANSNSQLR